MQRGRGRWANCNDISPGAVIVRSGCGGGLGSPPYVYAEVDTMTRYSLHRPLVVGPRVFTVLQLKAPTARALEALASTIPADDFDASLAVLSLFTGLRVAELENLSARDHWTLAKLIAASLGEVSWQPSPRN